GGVAGVEVGEIGYLVGAQRAAAASTLRPTMDAGLEEGPIDDKLAAACEQIEQTDLAAWAVELIRLVDRHPGHPATLGCQGVMGAKRGLLLDEQARARGVPSLRRHDWR